MAEAKILLIDDDEDLILAMKTVLAGKYTVLSADSGEEGLRRAAVEKPDLVILDVMMETGDKGFEVARKLKRDPGLAKVPILMLTAIYEKTGFDFSREAGDETWLPVDDYVEKPIRPDDLLAKVAALLKG